MDIRRGWAAACAAITLCGGLVACGGGGGSPGTPSPPPVTPPPVASYPDIPASDADAARFLAQATFGPTRAEIARLRQIGYRRWLDEQLDPARTPPTLVLPHLQQVVANGVPRDDLPLQRVDAVSGALMVVPRALFERVGGFDAGYRLHAEDLDLCRRVRAAGAAVACANDVRVVHVRGVSSRTRPWFVEWHKHRGLWRYYRIFDAAGHGAMTRAAVFAMVWGRFPFALLRALRRG